MADTVDIYIGGISLETARGRIERCTGLAAKTADYGMTAFPDHAHDRIAWLSTHDYPDGGDVDVSAHEIEFSAKNYEEAQRGNEDASATVRWFRSIFNCLKSAGDARLLLTYDSQYVLDSFDPTASRP